MPGSSARGKLQILEWRKELPRFRSVLDVGPGWGTYAKLLKRKGEIWEAVEVYEPYIEQYKLRTLYDRVFVGNILTFEPDKRYDLVILGDVLEHVSDEDGVKLLKKVLSYTNYCLVSLPLDAETHADQDNEHERWHNIHEKHLAHWSNKSLMATVALLGGEIIGLKKFQELGVYLIGNSHLNEKITSWDYLKHSGLWKERKLNFRTHLSGLIPKSVKKIIKK